MVTELSADVLDRIVAQNLGVYRAAPSRLREDLSQEAQVASDYRGRLVYELLQNADDAMDGQASGNDRVSFLVTSTELWMANSGRPLTESDVQGLCGLGASSKVDSAGTKRASIGHKGLGFKSVLEITDRPAAYSSSIAFELGTAHACPSIEALFEEMLLPKPTGVPAMRFPARVASLPSTWLHLAERGYQTAFCFPFREDLKAEQRRALGRVLLDLPLTTVLFLKHLEEVEVIVDDDAHQDHRTWRISRQRLHDGSWEACTGFSQSGLYTVNVGAEDGEDASFLVAHDGHVPITGKRGGLTGPAWEGVDTTEVSIALYQPTETMPTMPAEWRRFHVFLPTEEVCPYPMLVNGAFVSDLSRQHLRVSPDPDDYNAYMIQTAARVFVNDLLPVLCETGAERVFAALDRGVMRGEPSVQGAGAFLHDALCRELSGIAFIPSESGLPLALSDVVVPSTALGDIGVAYRIALPVDASWEGRRFPAQVFCAASLARIAVDHGATELRGADCLRALAAEHDPDRCRLELDESGGFEVDPILETCAALWQLSDPDERVAIAEEARRSLLFPVVRHDDGTVLRVSLGADTAFYPPRSAKHELPLVGLRFMCHSICWGALLPKERTVLLESRMNAWSALFDMHEFRFEEVMRAAVIPALVLNPDEGAVALRESLRSLPTLAAVCQLAGAFTKPDRPLRYQRLSSDRALFNLSRLPVPCRGVNGETWLPAYRVYFGSDWIGDDSVENVAIECGGVGELEPSFAFLASPSSLLGTLQSLDREDDQSTDEGEVGVDEDTDQALESNERDRWIAFLSWIGVNRSLRAVHFHDVEDDNTGWLTTKGLSQPQGRAFRDLDDTWDTYKRELLSKLSRRPDRDDVDPYLYEAHDLDQILAILACAENDNTGRVGSALYEHLVRHWASLSGFAGVQLALVDKEKWPGSRTKPPRAMAEEIHDFGDNLWVHRLKKRSFCPSSHGPRRPDMTWLPSPEIERRFSRRGRESTQLLPILEVDPALPSQSRRGLAERLGIRSELSPSTFSIDDAQLLCLRLRQLYDDKPSDAVWRDRLRTIIRPVYRQLFELLSGRSAEGGLSDILNGAPLLADTAEGFRFLPATKVLYAQSPGTRERSGVGRSVPMFVLEAEPAATSALVNLFGVRVLEESLEWHPDPGECAFEEDELQLFRTGLRDLATPLLARLRAERSDPRDRTALLDFVERVEPVTELSLSCSLDGTRLPQLASRAYFVAPKSVSGEHPAFVVCSGPPWPPSPETAQALGMAIADTLGINMVETFIAFIQSDNYQRRRLLDIAGATGHLDDAEAEIDDENAPADLSGTEAPRTTDPGATTPTGEQPAGPPPTPGSAAPPPIPLLRFEDLRIDGVPFSIAGEGQGRQRPDRKAGERGDGSGSNGSGHRAAAGTDLGALDSLGMRIAVSFEMRRLHAAGVTNAVAVVDTVEATPAESLVVDVHSPEAIRTAEACSPVVRQVLLELEKAGVSRLFPGFDLLTIRDGRAERLIELKSSGVDARVQAMSWNEWKTARQSHLRSLFWLYLAGNLRADLGHASPYLRAINDPFGALVADVVEDHQVRRAVQLRVREFAIAEQLDITVESR